MLLDVFILLYLVNCIDYANNVLTHAKNKLTHAKNKLINIDSENNICYLDNNWKSHIQNKA